MIGRDIAWLMGRNEDNFFAKFKLELEQIEDWFQLYVKPVAFESIADYFKDYKDLVITQFQGIT